ncbi:MAG: ComF family protein [Campylobacterales bacterium]|nr:ComF family protein [Campylobacterales bacterium]
MKCLLCESWSLSRICRSCREEHLAPSLHTRKIAGKLSVHSFYRYDEIESLLLTKHTDIGCHLYKIMASASFATYAASLEVAEPVAVIAVDDHVRHGYSHTAILARAMKTDALIPRHTVLRDRSGHRYSGQDFQYRLTHPRAFELKPFPEKSVILVDDILTTGLTLTQAAETLEMAGKEVLFCLTLADAER